MKKIVFICSVIALAFGIAWSHMPLWVISGAHTNPTGTSFQCSPSSWDPADGTEGDANATQQFTCTAVGAVTLSFININGGGSFANELTGSCSASTYTDEQCTIDFRFAYAMANCVDPDACSDTLTITSDADDQPETIALGPTAISAAFPSTGILSTFTGTNGNLPSGFSLVAGDPEIQSNQFASGVGTESTALWTTSYTANNLEAYWTVNTVPANGDYVNIYFGDGSFDGYAMLVQKVAGTDTFEAYVLNAGSLGTQIGSTQTQEVSNGDSLGFKLSGTTLQMWYKAAAGSWTQIGGDLTSSAHSPDQIALSVSNTVVRCDDFGGGTP